MKGDQDNFQQIETEIIWVNNEHVLRIVQGSI